MAVTLGLKGQRSRLVPVTGCHINLTACMPVIGEWLCTCLPGLLHSNPPAVHWTHNGSLCGCRYWSVCAGEFWTVDSTCWM